MRLRVGSLFSGIGGADLAFERAGADVLWQVEIDRDCNRILERHWPNVRRYADITECYALLDSPVKTSNNGDTSNGGEPMKLGDWYRKLTADQAEQAVKMYEAGLSLAPIAAYFSVTRQSMWDLLRRRTAMRPQKREGQANHFARNGQTADVHAQKMLEYAVRIGAAERKSACERCGDTGTFKDGRTKIQAHHCDYNKPLEVLWLCQKCHHEWHKNNTAIGLRGGAGEALAPVDVIVAGFP